MLNNEKENERVRKSITNALFTLLQTKNFSAITVTDIVGEAKVARASYYRNFHSKEDIIETYMDTAFENLVVDYIDSNKANLFDYDSMVEGFERSLTYFLMNKSYILSLYHHGFSNLIQEMFNRYIEELAGDMPSSSIDRFKLYFISGAAFSILIRWLQEGAIESPLEIAKITATYLLQGVDKKADE